MTLGQQLKAARTKIGMTQEVLANRTQKHVTDISQYEHDEVTPDLSSLLKLLYWLKQPMEFQYGGKRFVLKMDGVVK